MALSAPSSNKAPTLALRVYNTISLNPDKYGWVSVVSVLPISDVKKISSSDRSRLSSSAIGIESVGEKNSTPVYWCQQDGLGTMKHVQKQVYGTVLYAFRAGDMRSAFLYSKDAKHPLGLVVVEHESNPSHVRPKPLRFEKEISGLFEDVYTEARRDYHHADGFFSVPYAQIRDTDAGTVFAALVCIPQRQEVFCVTAALHDTQSWRRWSLPTIPVSAMKCVIAPDGKRVHLFRTAVRLPRRASGSAIAETIPQAFSIIERIPVDVDDVREEEYTGAGDGPVVPVCFAVRETLIPIAGAQSREEKYYESACCRVTGEEWRQRRSTLLFCEESNLLLTALVPIGSATYITHFTLSSNGGDGLNVAAMRCNCQLLPGLKEPLSLCTVEGISAANRPSRSCVSVALSKDLKIFACEVFGRPLQVNIEGSNCIPISVPLQDKKKKIAGGVTEKNKNGKEEFTKLSTLPNGEVLFANGAIAHFLCISYSYFGAEAPPSRYQYPSLAVLDSSRGDEAPSQVTVLQESMNALISRSSNAQEVLSVFTDNLLPALSFLGSASTALQMIQTVYRRVMEVAVPHSVEEWNRLWELTRLVQRVLARRHRDASVRYMDSFFLDLARLYQMSSFATPEGIQSLKEALLNVSSDELRLMILCPKPSPGMQYLLSEISSQGKYISLARDLVKRLAAVTVTEKGMCVAYSSPESVSLLHTMGFVLLSSCMDLPIHVIVGKDHKCVKCDIRPPSDGRVSLQVPVQSFEDQNEFNSAIALAADLLATAPASSYSEVEAAVFTICISQRYHCLSTLLELLGPVISDAISRASPIHDNKEWMEECAFAASLDCDQQLVKIIASADGRHPIFPSLCFMLQQQNSALNLPLFRVLEKQLAPEVSAACLAALVFAATESLIAAINNYAAGVMKFVKSTQPLEQESSEAIVNLLRGRLQAVVKRNRELWGYVHYLLPYKAKDLAESYTASIAMSKLPQIPEGASGTVLSRAIVMCFRIFVFVSFSVEALDYIDDATDRFLNPKANSANKSALHSAEERCLSSLRYMFLAEESVIPKEWLQYKMLGLIRAARSTTDVVPPYAQWSSFLLRVLDLTDIALRCSVAGIKKQYFELTDELRGVGRAGGAEAHEEGELPLRKFFLMAEEVAASHRNHLHNNEVSLQFIFSQKRDSSLPRWAFSHELRERKYLIDVEWVHHLWALEAEDGLINSIAVAVAEQVMWESDRIASYSPAATAPADASFARPLFASIHDILLPGHCLADEVPNGIRTVPQKPFDSVCITSRVAENTKVLRSRSGSLHPAPSVAVPTAQMAVEHAVTAADYSLPPVISAPPPPPPPGVASVATPGAAVGIAGPPLPIPDHITLSLTHTAAPPPVSSHAVVLPLVSTSTPNATAAEAQADASGGVSLSAVTPLPSPPLTPGPPEVPAAPAAPSKEATTPPLPVNTQTLEAVGEPMTQPLMPAAALESDTPSPFSVAAVAWWESDAPVKLGAAETREQWVGRDPTVAPSMETTTSYTDTTTSISERSFPRCETVAALLSRGYERKRSLEDVLRRSPDADGFIEVMSWNSEHLKSHRKKNQRTVHSWDLDHKQDLHQRHGTTPDDAILRRYIRNVSREARRTGVRCCRCRRECANRDKVGYSRNYYREGGVGDHYERKVRRAFSERPHREPRRSPRDRDDASYSEKPRYSYVERRRSVPEAMNPTTRVAEDIPNLESSRPCPRTVEVQPVTVKPLLPPSPPLPPRPEYGPPKMSPSVVPAVQELCLLSLDRHHMATESSARGVYPMYPPPQPSAADRPAFFSGKLTHDYPAVHMPVPVPAQPKPAANTSSSPPLLKLGGRSQATSEFLNATRKSLPVPPQNRMLLSGVHPGIPLYVPPSPCCGNYQSNSHSAQEAGGVPLLSLGRQNGINTQSTGSKLREPMASPCVVFTGSPDIARRNQNLNPCQVETPQSNITPASTLASPSPQSLAPSAPEIITVPTPIPGSSYSAALTSFLDGVPPPPPSMSSQGISPPSTVTTPPPPASNNVSSLPVAAVPPPPASNNVSSLPVAAVPPLPTSNNVSSLSVAAVPPPPPSISIGGSPPAPVSQPASLLLAHPPPIPPSPGVPLTPSEQVDFNRYVSELQSQGAASTPLPRPLSISNTAAVGEACGTSDSCQQALRTLLEQQQSFFSRTEEIFRQRDSESQQMCRRLETAIGSAPFADGVMLRGNGGIFHGVGGAPSPIATSLGPAVASAPGGPTLGGVALPASLPTGDALQRQREELLLLTEKTLEKEIEEARSRYTSASVALSTLSNLPTSQSMGTAALTNTLQSVTAAPLPAAQPITAAPLPAAQPVTAAPLPAAQPVTAAHPAPTPTGLSKTKEDQRPSPGPPRKSPAKKSSRAPPPRDLQELYHRGAISRSSRAPISAARPTFSSSRAASRSIQTRKATEREKAKTEVATCDVQHAPPALAERCYHVEAPLPSDGDVLHIPSCGDGVVKNYYVERQANRRKENILKRLETLNKAFAF